MERVGAEHGVYRYVRMTLSSQGFYVLRKTIKRPEKERKQGRGGYIISTPETGQ